MEHKLRRHAEIRWFNISIFLQLKSMVVAVGFHSKTRNRGIVKEEDGRELKSEDLDSRVVKRKTKGSE